MSDPQGEVSCDFPEVYEPVRYDNDLKVADDDDGDHEQFQSGEIRGHGRDLDNPSSEGSHSSDGRSNGSISVSSQTSNEGVGGTGCYSVSDGSSSDSGLDEVEGNEADATSGLANGQ
ncbi:MAG: hypothetical protein MMC23_004803 [Stictis urceolatum]|nr:hypothetical protein [Stictis urceolata]